MQDRFLTRYYDTVTQQIIKLNTIINTCENGKNIEFYGICISGEGQISQVDLDKNEYRFKRIQCTGLKDKNGKLIYEGDVVQTTFDDNSKTIFYVIWNNENALFNGKIIKKGETNAFCINEDYLYYLLANGIDEKTEVIGNIYENPELLEDK